MTPTSKKLSGGRLAAVIAGGSLALVGLMLALAGAGLLWAEDHKDRDGYYTTGTERYSTDTYAVASESLDIDGIPYGDEVYGKVRLKVQGNDGAPVFVGIARSDDVDAYLAGTAHATLTDVDYSPFEPAYRTTAGDRAPARPGTQSFWVASAEGTGTQTVNWNVDNGDWSVVVMNADGSRGVDAGVSAGANVPLIGDLALAASIAALVLLLGGGSLLAGGLIRPRPRPSSPVGSASAA
jgi:hypothetical protein